MLDVFNIMCFVCNVARMLRADKGVLLNVSESFKLGCHSHWLITPESSTKSIQHKCHSVT